MKIFWFWIIILFIIFFIWWGVWGFGGDEAVQQPVPPNGVEVIEVPANNQ